MRRFLLFAVLVGVAISNAGCFINQYSSDPQLRTIQLLNHSEDLRQLEQEWSRFWMNDQPSHLTPERVHGGIQ